MDKPWNTSGSSSWPKTKKGSSKKKNSKRKASSLPAVPAVSGVITRPSPPTYRPKSAQPQVSLSSTLYTSPSSLRVQGGSVRPRSAHRACSQRSFEADPPRPRSAQSSSQLGHSAHSKQVYYSSSFECLVDNLDPLPQGRSVPKTTEYYNTLKIWTRSRRARDVFPFGQLPTDCKLKVFSYFSAPEKGELASVCREWRDLMKTSSLWKNVDFTEFTFTCLPKTRHFSPEGRMHICFQCHRKRVHKFIKFLIKLRPLVTRLVFNYDIADTCDGWLTMLHQLLDSLPLRDLAYAQLKWKDTPMKSFCLDPVDLGDNTETIVYRHRHRQRLFVQLFDKFTTLAPNVKTLILPFDWSERSVACLSRLKSLHSLVLEKYFVFQRLDQDLLSRLFTGLPSLERLMLEVWTPSGRGLIKYHIQSESLRYLDISQSRGFYLQNVWLPNLRQFYVARHPWNGPLIQADQIILPCLYGTLTTGAPKLEKLNGHVLHADWRCNLYPDLEEALKAVCSCRQHKPGWAM